MKPPFVPAIAVIPHVSGNRYFLDLKSPEESVLIGNIPSGTWQSKFAAAVEEYYKYQGVKEKLQFSVWLDHNGDVLEASVVVGDSHDQIATEEFDEGSQARKMLDAAENLLASFF